MKKFLKSYASNFLLIVLFTALVLYLTLKDNVTDVLNILNHANPCLLLMVFVLSFGSQCLLALILRSLTRLSKPDYAFHESLLNALVASFFHGVTPSATGGQFAQVYVFKKQGVPVSDSASILWMDFILYQSTMVLTVLVLFLLRFRILSSSGGTIYVLVFLGFAVNVCVIAGLWAIAHFKKFYTWLSTRGIEIGASLKLIKNREKALSNLKGQLERFDSETKRLKQHRPLILKTVALNAARQALLYCIPYFCALALGIPVSIHQLLDVMALSSFVAMVNCFIPIPGSSGGTEATFVLMFSTIFNKIEAAGMMILWRFATYYLIMIVGGLAFVFVKAQDRMGIKGVQE